MHQYVGRNYEAVAAKDYESDRPWRGRELHVLGFHFGTQIGFLASWYAAFIPLWLVWALLAILPAFQIWTWWNGIAQKIHLANTILANRCTKCGYDLRATPGRCPECGTMAKKMHVSN